MRIKIASRKSDLARWQAVQVARAFEGLSEKPSIEFIFKSSLGDQNLDLPLAGMGAKGVFTEDFYQDLVSGVCDLVVHSWKDLPVDIRPDTQIAMTLTRADVRDIILIPEVVWTKACEVKKLTVLTSSPRRVYNLERLLSKLLPFDLAIEFKNVRGNVPTRLSKMHSEQCALVLAKAGLDRRLQAEADGFLSISLRDLIKDCRFQVLPMSLNPPAPAQGALAVEVLRTNTQILELCARLNHELTFKCVEREREILKSYGGGCHQKIGVAILPRHYGTVMSLQGQTDDGKILNELSIQDGCPWTRASEVSGIFPQRAQDHLWFERDTIEVPNRILDEEAFLVARADAWPSQWQPRKNQIVWSAGIQTWMRLAERGIFVNGCQDGLGEGESSDIDLLVGHHLEWCKLSHRSAPFTTRGLATYQLTPCEVSPDLKGKTHFFWMSRSQFERAFQLFPKEILSGKHACGPGHTYEFLSSFKNLNGPIKVFMNLDQFLKETRPVRI